MKNSGLSTGLFRDNTRRKNKHKRKTKQCVWFTAECEKKRKEKPFLEQRINICAYKMHTPLKFEHKLVVNIKKDVNKQFRKYHSDLVK